MKTTTFLAGLCALFLSVCLWGCKLDKPLQPTAKNTQFEQVSADPLINYLSKISNVSPGSISFDNSSNQYVIRNTVKISKQQLEKSYSTANEFKIRNGILQTKTIANHEN